MTFLITGGFMNRLVATIAAAATFAGLAVLPALPTASAASSAANTLPTGGALPAGKHLLSGNRVYAVTMWSSGSLVITRRGTPVWVVRSGHPGSRLVVGRNGNLVIAVGTRVVWETGTTTSGATNNLAIANDGTLLLRNATGVVWSNRLPNGCRTTTVAKRFIVSIRSQVGRMCAGRHQILTTAVTTGASALGYGTPLGSWRVQAKVPNTVLHPAAGGAYPVRYWVPYDGVYGIHDSNWQRFPYGSALYRTQGSHGCVHLPGATMAWFFRWVAVGTTVTIAA
jgi:lipoprotein-anchoring transpeptidase ErfK/SrfK